MPSETMKDLGVDYFDIEHLMAVRSRLGVSSEALLRRVVGVANKRISMFSAHRIDGDGERAMSIDYTVDSPAGPVHQGTEIPTESGLWDCSSIGHTVSHQERWGASEVRVEAIAVSPYPGQRLPRIVGLIRSPEDEPEQLPNLAEVPGDLFPLPLQGKQMICTL